MSSAYSPPIGLRCMLLATILVAAALPCAAATAPAPNLLLPWFDVSLEEGTSRTMFSVVNASPWHTRVAITLFSNRGLAVGRAEVALAETESYSVDLTDWIVGGRSPDRILAPEELAHLQAALSGIPSPRDGQTYSELVLPKHATGYVVLQCASPANGSLMGSALVVDLSTNHVEGSSLVPLDEQLRAECARHAIRIPAELFLLSEESRLIVWTGVGPDPVAAPRPAARQASMTATVFDTGGNKVAACTRELVAAQLVDFCLDDPTMSIGWIEIATDGPAAVIGRLVPAGDGAFEIQAFCLPDDLVLTAPSILITTRVNGGGTDTPPGIIIPTGEALVLEYEVTNLGDSPIDAIVVTDSQGLDVVCPATALEPDASMLCTASTLAAACRHEHVGHATARAGDGTQLHVSDAAWYNGTVIARIAIESSVNGDDADEQPGPTISEGSMIELSYDVKNAGEVPLTSLAISDSSGATVTCPVAALAPGETVRCTATLPAVRGQHDLVATAKAGSPCRTVEASDPWHYFGRAVVPAIQIVKSVDGEDANTPPGPPIPIGQAIEFRFVVTNVGTEPLGGVSVTDDELGAVTCPRTSLEVGESMTCLAPSVALACAQLNVATAAGTPALGASVSDDDAANYFGVSNAALALETLLNGESADDPPGVQTVAGEPLLLAFVVTNAGDVRLAGVAVTDDQSAVVTCPKTILEPGELMTCTATGSALAGQQKHTGSVAGTPPCGPGVSASNPAHYFGATASISLEILVNGLEAGTAPGAHVPTGTLLQWSHVVTNSGSAPLSIVTVVDGGGTSIACPESSLEPAESMTCMASSIALAGQQSLAATASGIGGVGTVVTAADSAFCFGHFVSIQIETRVNGETADVPPGPEIDIGSVANWTFEVMNTGDIALGGVAVTCDTGLAVTCPKIVLEAGETMTCTASGVALAGLHATTGTATGTALGQTVNASDPAHYTGIVANHQGCTPGYWKNHTSSWPPTGYATSEKVKNVFTEAWRYPSGGATLQEALGFGGGSGVNGAAEILLRAAVAALLNASHPGVSYPRNPSDVLTQANAALASYDRDTMLALAAQLDADNNLGCPLN